MQDKITDFSTDYESFKELDSNREDEEIKGIEDLGLDDKDDDD